MFNFKKVILHNFGSYGHTELDLQERGFCQVIGQNNFKKDNAISNGAGKSFLWSAICFALTGETIQGLRTNLKNINIDDDSCFVYVAFDCNDISYEITRHIAPKSDLKIIKNSIDISGKGLRESEKKLGEVLPDITKDLIASTIIIGQGLPNKFSSFSPSGRKELLEKLTKADFMIEDIKARVTTRQQEVATKLREYEDSLLIHRTKESELNRQLFSISKDIQELDTTNYDLELLSAKTLLSRNETSLQEVKAEIARLEATGDAYNAQWTELIRQKGEDESSELAAYNQATSTAFANKSTIAAQIYSIEGDIKKVQSIRDVCPTCGQKIPGIIKPDTSTQQAQLIAKQEELAAIDAQLKKYNEQHINYNKQIKEAYAIDLDQLTAQINGNKQALTKARDKQAELLTANKQFFEQVNKLTIAKQTADQRLSTAKAQQANLQEQLRVTLSAIKLVEESKIELDAHQAVLKKMENLIKRDFRGFLLQNIIAYIDLRAKDFSEIVFGTRELEVFLDGNALDISYCGKLFDNLSGGEKQRVDLILQFAIRDMLSVYLGISANVLVLDEITDFLDKKSCSAIMNLVSKELADVESVFIVSHHASELDLPVDSTITIVKNEDGISEII